MIQRGLSTGFQKVEAIEGAVTKIICKLVMGNCLMTAGFHRSKTADKSRTHCMLCKVTCCWKRLPLPARALNPRDGFSLHPVTTSRNSRSAQVYLPNKRIGESDYLTTDVFQWAMWWIDNTTTEINTSMDAGRMDRYQEEIVVNRRCSAWRSSRWFMGR